MTDFFETAFGPRSLQGTGQSEHIYWQKRWRKIRKRPFRFYRHIAATRGFAVNGRTWPVGSPRWAVTSAQCTTTFGRLWFSQQYCRLSKRMWCAMATTMTCRHAAAAKGD
eukprot:XP_016662494.1 PREDICTED: uncharacterized protein LOC107884586 [Acyrthosiphon pisum]